MPTPPHDSKVAGLSNPQPSSEATHRRVASQKLADGTLDPLKTPTALEFNQPAFQYNASLHPLETADHACSTSPDASRASPLSIDLHLQTNLQATHDPVQQKEVLTDNVASFTRPQSPPDYRHQLASPGSIPVRTSSVRSLAASYLSAGSLSPASVMSSPGMGPLQDITPLPSPINSRGGSWVNLPGPATAGSPPSTGFLSSPTSIIPKSSPPKKRKPYIGLVSSVEQASAPAEGSRSVSEYSPPAHPAPRPRQLIQLSDAVVPPAPPTPMQREEYLAVQRGIHVTSASRPPTPPRSSKGATDSSESGSAPNSPMARAKVPKSFEASTVHGARPHTFAAIRQLGTGTFSKVMLATGELDKVHLPEEQLDPKRLVAVKICEHGPAGGADEKKIESSLKRELEILRSINHPSLVHLRATNLLEKRAYLVLNYASGGDLFEFASRQRQLLTPPLVRRIFAELVAAVLCLHDQYIVHRDIKLENVLVNYPADILPSLSPETHPHPIITLTDLGLGRRIPPPPASPLLDTRCGSEDYAAPELLMGQPYDGRATDAWALGVTLYALMEGCLPFDPLPGSRKQSPTAHRIARCEWAWRRWAGDDGEWDAIRGTEYAGAEEIVAGLLCRKRSRWGLDKVQAHPWVKEALEGVELKREGWEEGED